MECLLPHNLVYMYPEALVFFADCIYLFLRKECYLLFFLLLLLFLAQTFPVLFCTPLLQQMVVINAGSCCRFLDLVFSFARVFKMFFILQTEVFIDLNVQWLKLL